MSVNKTIIGRVISDKMEKTIVVLVESLYKHPFYGKYIKKRIKCYAHDESNTSKCGDVVQLKYTRPLSKTKNWVLIKIIEKAKE